MRMAGPELLLLITAKSVGTRSRIYCFSLKLVRAEDLFAPLLLYIFDLSRLDEKARIGKEINSKYQENLISLMFL